MAYFGVCWRRNAHKVPILPCRDSLIFCHTRQNGITGYFPFALVTRQNERKSSPICFTPVKLVFLARDLARLPRFASGLAILGQANGETSGFERRRARAPARSSRYALMLTFELTLDAAAGEIRRVKYLETKCPRRDSNPRPQD